MTSPSEPDPVQDDTAELQAAAEALVPIFYADLRSIARRERGRGAPQQTLQTTALINETYLKLRRSPRFESRRHFLGAAAIAMRQVLIDYARTAQRDKRGAGAEHVSLDEVAELQPELPADLRQEDILSVHQAVEKLEKLDPRMARIVVCRFFAGYDEPETAEALGISERTLRREWVQAKAWLFRELKEKKGSE